jgi:hypothetical protein
MSRGQGHKGKKITKLAIKRKSQWFFAYRSLNFSFVMHILKKKATIVRGASYFTNLGLGGPHQGDPRPNILHEVRTSNSRHYGVMWSDNTMKWYNTYLQVKKSTREMSILSFSLCDVKPIVSHNNTPIMIIYHTIIDRHPLIIGIRSLSLTPTVRIATDPWIKPCDNYCVPPE